MKTKNKFRIVEIQKTNALGNVVSTSYKIQKKFLWFFRDFKCSETKTNIYAIQCFVHEKVNRIFDTLEEVQEYLEIVLDSYELTYRGNKIRKIYNAYSGYLFVNFSKYILSNGKKYYNCNKDLEILKINIDGDIITTKETIINL